MKSIKILVKQILSFIYHPILYIQLVKRGGDRLLLGRRLRIKNSKYLRVGSNVTINDNARFLFVDECAGYSYDPQVTIGNGVFITYNFTLMAAAPVVIHDGVLIASNVMITSENHGTSPENNRSYASTPLEGKAVEIGSGCWLCEKVMIMPGVTLGERCIVAAGAVVTKSFPAYSMVAGVPAKIVKRYSFQTHQWERVENK